MSFPSPARVMILDQHFNWVEIPKYFIISKSAYHNNVFYLFCYFESISYLFLSSESVNESKNNFNFDYDSLHCTSLDAVDWIPVPSLLCVVLMI